MKIKLRLSLLSLLVLIIPAGFYTKFYTGPGQSWVHSYAGDIFYPMFWIFLVLFVKPLMDPLKATALVFVFTVIVEFSQLLNNSVLQDIRQSFIGRTLVGVSFSMTDIFWYLTGCILAFIVYQCLLHIFRFPMTPLEP